MTEIMPAAIQDKERELKRKERDALLQMVDALEDYLDMPKTSDIRRFAKDNGYYDQYRVSTGV